MTHGGNIYRYRDVLDFSANINPLGVPESVRRAVAESISDIDKYPDPECTALRERLSAAEDIPAENIVCGNGADDLIFRIVRALRPHKAMICVPAFTEYSRSLKETGCEVYEHRLTEENGFELTEQILEELDSTFDMCIFCTPNNPTGKLISPGLLGKISENCEKNGIYLLCDECFLGFIEDGQSFSLRRYMNSRSIILKAFTKIYAIPGIRLGYAFFGDEETADKVSRCGQFWSVSLPAQRAGTAALDEEEFIRRTVMYVKEERDFLISVLRAAGAEVIDPAANFILFRSIAGLFEKMLREGVLIRKCDDFSGLPDNYYRIAVRTHDENIRFSEALRRCIYG